MIQQPQVMLTAQPGGGTRVLNEQEKYLRDMQDQQNGNMGVNKADRYLQEVREQNGEFEMQTV